MWLPTTYYEHLASGINPRISAAVVAEITGIVALLFAVSTTIEVAIAWLPFFAVFAILWWFGLVLFSANVAADGKRQLRRPWQRFMKAYVPIFVTFVGFAIGTTIFFWFLFNRTHAG